MEQRVSFAIVLVLALLVMGGLLYLGLLSRRRRGGQRTRHQNPNQTPEVPALASSPRTEEPRPGAVATKPPSLTVQVQEAVYPRIVRTSEPKSPTTMGSTPDPNPMLYIHVKATLTPTGKLPLQTIHLLSNGEVFPSTDIPESVLDEEQTLVLHFEAPSASLEPALRQGASLSYVRVTTPTLDVRSNPFILKPAEPPSR